MNLELIKPKNLKVSDKYSSNLYKYLKKEGDVKIYYRKVNTFTEENNVFAVDKLTNYDVIIGKPCGNDIIGNGLTNILRKLPQLNYCYLNALDEYYEITDEFFDAYKLIGRCLFDPNHSSYLLGDDKRLTYQGESTRFCNWCGHRQTKHVETEVREYEVWK